MSSAIPTDSSATANPGTPVNPTTPADSSTPVNPNTTGNPSVANLNATAATAESDAAAASAPLRPLAQAQFPTQAQFPGQTAAPLSAPLNPVARFGNTAAFSHVTPSAPNPRREKRRFIILLIVIALLCGVSGGIGGAAIMESFSRPDPGSSGSMQTGRGRYGMPDEDQSSGSSTSDSTVGGDSITA